jgi:BASS family bile acid:Na+ symporter
MFLAAILGFVFPSLSLSVFPFLPLVLFFLMTLTLLGIKQAELIVRLRNRKIWLYSSLHAIFYMLFIGLIGWLFSANASLQLAMVAVAATGSLFATPAIVRALGFDSVEAMAMTIATTLLLPLVIFVTLLIYQGDSVHLDLVAYFLRLIIFVFGPMAFSFLVHAIAPREALDRMLVKISPYTILLVFAFPFGLIGSFRVLFDQDPMAALNYLLVAMGLCALFFSVSLLVYWRSGKEIALTAAITSGNRNVLLTYSIAGALLGPAFLPLAGALQLPTSLLPVITRWLNKKL